MDHDASDLERIAFEPASLWPVRGVVLTTADAGISVGISANEIGGRYDRQNCGTELHTGPKENLPNGGAVQRLGLDIADAVAVGVTGSAISGALSPVYSQTMVTTAMLISGKVSVGIEVEPQLGICFSLAAAWSTNQMSSPTGLTREAGAARSPARIARKIAAFSRPVTKNATRRLLSITG